MEYKHRPLHIAVIVTSTVTMCLMFFFNAISSAPETIPGMYVSSTTNVSDKNYLEITPAGWTFIIWGVIYCWQVLFMGYSLSTICRPGVSGYLYYSPNHNPIWIHLLYILNNIANITWLFMFDREFMVAALIVFMVILGSLIAMLVVSMYYLHLSFDTLKKNGMMKEVWMTRFFVQNAFGVYATWCSIAILLNAAIVGTYVAGADQSSMSTKALCILLVIIIVWVSLDTFLLHRHTNFLFSPHLVLVWAITGSLQKNYNPWATNTVLTVVLLTLAILALISKIILMVWRACRQAPDTPLVSPAPSPDLQEKVPVA